MDKGPIVSQANIEAVQARFMSKVFSWMTGGLLLTGIIAMYLVESDLILYILSNSILFYGSIVGELVLVWQISKRATSMKSTSSALMFVFYSALNGITLSVILYAYTWQSIQEVFFITAGSFAALAMFGFVTKKNLGAWGNFLMIALVGLLIAIVINIFMASPALNFAISVVGVLLFAGLTAYDTQKLKEMAVEVSGSEALESNMVIGGALSLYLDFINLFIFLLRLLGNRD